MIIKSMSRKEPSFGALMNYIDRELGTETHRVRHNVMGRGADPIRTEFERNAGLLKKRKNGVYLYHEIISITRAQGLDAKAQQELLHQLVQQYIDARCPENLVYGGLHQDKDHSYHYHLMISANRAGDTGRLRLTKKQFRDIQVQLEAHVLEKHPELEQQVAMAKRAEHRRSRGSVEHERRTGRPPSRTDALRGRVQAAYAQSDSREAFMEALTEQGFRHEPRGKISARVIDEYTGKVHRVATLDADLAVKFDSLMSEPAREDKKRPDLEAARASRENAADEKEKPAARKTRAEAREEADRTRDAAQAAEPVEPARAASRAEARAERDVEAKRSQRDDARGPDRANDGVGDMARDDAAPGTDMPDTGAPEAAMGGMPPGYKYAQMAKKVVEQGMEEAREIGSRLREGFLGDKEPAQDAPSPEREAEAPEPQSAASEKAADAEATRADKQNEWRRESQERREAGRDEPEQERE